MSPTVQALLGWLVGIVVFVLLCGLLLPVSTMIPQPLPIDDVGKALISVALLGASPLLAGWLAWLVARAVRGRLMGSGR